MKSPLSSRRPDRPVVATEPLDWSDVAVVQGFLGDRFREGGLRLLVSLGKTEGAAEAIEEFGRLPPPSDQTIARSMEWAGERTALKILERLRRRGRSTARTGSRGAA